MLFAHLGSIIVGLGAAVVLEFNGLLWIDRPTRRSTTCGTTSARSRRSRGSASSGCSPAARSWSRTSTDPLTVVKMIAVLAGRDERRRDDAADRRARPAAGSGARFSLDPRARCKLWCVWSALVSQVGLVDGGDHRDAEHRLALNSQWLHSQGRGLGSCHWRASVPLDSRAVPDPRQVPPPEDSRHA